MNCDSRVIQSSKMAAVVGSVITGLPGLNLFLSSDARTHLGSGPLDNPYPSVSDLPLTCRLPTQVIQVTPYPS